MKKIWFFIITFFLAVIDLCLTLVTTAKYGIGVERNFLLKYFFNLIPEWSFEIMMFIIFVVYIYLWDIMFDLESKFKSLKNITVYLLVLYIGVYIIVYTKHIVGWMI